MFQGLKSAAKNAFKAVAAPAAIATLAFSPASHAEADIVVHAEGIVTQSTQVVPGTVFDFTATIDADTPDALPAFDNIGSFQDNPFENFVLQIGQGLNMITIEGGAGGEIGITPITDSGFLRINDFDVENVTGLPAEFSFETFSVGFSEISLADDSLLGGLNAFENSDNGTFNASFSPTTASGTISSFTVTNTTSVPEPSALALLAVGTAGLASRRRREGVHLTNG